MYNYFELLEKATIIRDETRNRANTAVRVGNMFIDILNWIDELHQKKDDDKFFEEYVMSEQVQDEEGNILLDEEGNVVTIEHKSVKLRNVYEGMWAEGWVSSLGINPNSPALSGSCDIDIVDEEDFFGSIDIPSGGELAALKDVTITDPEEGDVLVYTMTGNGLRWVNGKVFGDSEYASKLGSDEGFWTFETLTTEFGKYVPKTDFTKQKIEEILGKKYWANLEVSDSAKTDTIPTFDTIIVKKILLGDGEMTWDGTNKAIRSRDAVYSESWMSSLGINKNAASVISVSGAPASGQNAVVGYDWDPTTQHLTFNYGTITSGGSGVDASWGTSSGNKASLTIGTTTKTVLLDGALNGYLKSVSWSDINGDVPTWNQDTTGKAKTAGTADVANSILETLKLGTLWGNDFYPSDTIDGDIKLGSGKKLLFSDSGNIGFSDNAIRLSTATSINGGPLIEYDSENDAYRIHGNLYTDGWTSSLGMNKNAENVISVSGTAASGDNAITGYTWNPSTKHLEFTFGKIETSSPGSSDGGGGADVKWVGAATDDFMRYLEIDGDGEWVVLAKALDSFNPTVDWSDVPNTLNTKANTAGTADYANALNNGAALGTLWGNAFTSGGTINGNIKLADEKYIMFGNSGEKIYCEEDDKNIIHISTAITIDRGSMIEWDSKHSAYSVPALKIGEGVISWDADNSAMVFSSAIWSESWISSLGANSATMDEVTINRRLKITGETITYSLKVGATDNAGIISILSGTSAPNGSIFNSAGDLTFSNPKITIDAQMTEVKGQMSVAGALIIGGKNISATQLSKLADFANKLE